MKSNTFTISIADLPRRAGEMKEKELISKVVDDIGTPTLKVPHDEEININYRLESVSEGVLVSGNLTTFVAGECGRCLDEVSFDIDENFMQLYFYEAPVAEKSLKSGKGHSDSQSRYGSKSTKGDKKDLAGSGRSEGKPDKTLADLAGEEEFYVVNDSIDLQQLVVDSIALNLPFSPLCSNDCPGLCNECGEKLRDLPLDHSHAVPNPAWDALSEVKFNAHG